MASAKNHKLKHVYALQTTLQVALVVFLTSTLVIAHPGASSNKTVSAKKVSSETTTVKPKVGPSAVVPKTAAATPAASPHPLTPAPDKSSPAPVATTTPGSGVHSLSPSPAPSSGTSSSSTGSSSPPATTYTSLNWAGYLSNNGTYSAVSADWTVPTASGNGATASADATWTGIGGVSSHDLIQAGTENTVEPNGQVFTSAFYELLPASAQLIPAITVHPGDSMSVSIQKLSGTSWFISVADNTTAKTFSITVVYASSESSAEWIEEDPSYVNGTLVPFDNFTTVPFSSGNTTLNGSKSTISSSGSSLITLVNQSGQALATPTLLNPDGVSFSVNRN